MMYKNVQILHEDGWTGILQCRFFYCTWIRAQTFCLGITFPSGILPLSLGSSEGSLTKVTNTTIIVASNLARGLHQIDSVRNCFTDIPELQGP